MLLLLSALPAHARHKSESWARAQFSKAATMQEALGGRPGADRSRREYERVIDAYRRVYFGAPASSKAEPSVVASAELMVEMGRRFDDSKTLHAAIKQYEFLRREYPGSKYRFQALFTIGEIYKDDLGDSAKARATFEDFLQRYPRNRLADEARQALAAPVQQAAMRTADSNDDTTVPDAGKSVADDSRTKAAIQRGESRDDKSQADKTQDDKISRVTGIRHWSTPDYTRVAIDLEQDVKFESQRISNPERIFFDLRNTRLASTLVGKSFEVDDGLLQKIRVAQYQPKRTRIVLEIGERSDYHAFLLSNPSRLMIDIHGKPAATAAAKAGEVVVEQQFDSAKSRVEGSASTEVISDDSDDDASPAAPIAKKNSGSIKTVVGASGVKKTIVDADDEDALNGNHTPDLKADAKKPVSLAAQKLTPAEKESQGDTVATVDTPGLRNTNASSTNPPAEPAAKPESTSSISSRAKSHMVKGKNNGADHDIREAQPRAGGDRSLTRALGLKIGKIVIDPGHGGYDTGTIGPNGLQEKDLVLDVSHRLGKLLESRMGEEVVYTRRDDTFIPLETRTAIANQEQADLFVSVHANSSHDPDARGVETYYLNFTSSPDALEVAARENAVSEKSIHELQDLVKKIALREKIEESQEFASDVEGALHNGLAAKNPGLRDRGVKKAPFIVLIGANMPSILAEISFVSNPGDERRLRSAEYRQRIAESLYRGIAKYVGGLSGVRIASRMEKSAGQ